MKVVTHVGSSRLLSTGLAVLCLTAAAGFGQPLPPDGAKQDEQASKLFSMDLDALSNTKVTTASKFSEKLSDAPSDMSVVTKDELRRFGGVTLFEILERVAGLTGSSAFFADRSIIAARGDQTRTDAGHILILINGRPVREVIEGGVSSDILESFPVNLLERIEVIKGPGSVLYGSDAYSGVINLITQKADNNGFHASAAGGGAGEAAGSEEILFERGGLNVVEGAQYHQMPLWNTVFQSFPNPSNLAYSQNATVRDDGEGAYLGLNYKGLSFMSSYTAAEEASFVRGIVGDVRLKRGFGDLGYSLKAAAKWQMTFNLTYTRFLLDAPAYPDAHRDATEADFEWTNFVTFSERDRLTFGTTVNRIQGKEMYSGVQPALTVEDAKRWGGGFYIQQEHRLTGDLTLIGGVQANKIGSLAWNVVPRGGILWNPAEHFTMKALYGGAFRAPSLDESGLTHPGLTGNPKLVPEKVGTLDLQLSYQNNRVQASVDYFHSRETQLIFEDGSTRPALYYNLNAPATFRGIDTEGKYYILRSWFVMGSVLYQVNHDNSIANLSAIPSLGAKAGVSYMAENGADVSVFDAYQGHIGGYAASINPRPEAFHSVSVHARFDLTKHWLKSSAQGFALFVHGDDLANNQIWLPALGTNSANTIPVVRGRTIYFGIEVWQKQ
jgi:outer membrane receptor for ferrienterochelin and colicin